MRILLISQYFWPEHFVVNSLSTELEKRGHKVSVLTGLPNYPQGHFFSGYSFFKGPWTEDYQGVQVKRVPLLPRKKGFLSLALNYLSFVIFGVLLGPLRVGKNYDVIFCFGLSPITLCLPAVFMRKISGKPLIFWVQDLWPESVAAVGASNSGFVLRLVGKLVRFIYKRCDVILVQSKAFTESVLQWGGTSEKIHYIPNWAKIPEHKQSFPEWLKQFPQGFRVVFAGNIGKAQDMHTVLKAAEILKKNADIHWLIVGDGSEKEFVEQEILSKKLQDNVHMYGRRPSEDMPALLASGDIMLVSLTKAPIFSLTVPSKVQGYMACAKPILASLNGEGAKIIAEAQAGLSCPAEDPDELAKAVLRFYQMPTAERQKMGSNGFEYFKTHFEQSIVINQIEAICRKVASEGIRR